MALAHVQTASGSTDGTSLAVAFASNNTAGNLLVYQAGASTGIAFSISDTRNSPTVRVQINDTADNTLRLYDVQNCAAGANTVTNSGGDYGFRSLVIMEWSGAAMSSAFDVGSTGTNWGASSSSGAISIAQANELLVGGTHKNTTAATAPGTNWTERAEGGGTKGFHNQTQVTSATGSYTSTATWTGNTNWVAVIGAWKEAAAAAGRRFRKRIT